MPRHLLGWNAEARGRPGEARQRHPKAHPSHPGQRRAPQLGPRVEEHERAVLAGAVKQRLRLRRAVDHDRGRIGPDDLAGEPVFSLAYHLGAGTLRLGGAQEGEQPVRLVRVGYRGVGPGPAPGAGESPKGGAEAIHVRQPEWRSVLGDQLGGAHAAFRTVCASRAAGTVPLRSSSTATGSRQRPEAASSMASGSTVRKCSIAQESGRERLRRIAVVATVSPSPSAGYTATRRAKSATMSSWALAPVSETSTAQLSPRSGRTASRAPSTPRRVSS